MPRIGCRGGPHPSRPARIAQSTNAFSDARKRVESTPADSIPAGDARLALKRRAGSRHKARRAVALADAQARELCPDSSANLIDHVAEQDSGHGWRVDPKYRSASHAQPPLGGFSCQLSFVLPEQFRIDVAVGFQPVLEDTIEETFAFYRLPRQHHKHLKSTNMLERFNQEIKRRTHIVRVFPNGESCLRLIRALAVETHEDWLEANRYINMKLLKEHKRELIKEAA